LTQRPPFKSRFEFIFSSDTHHTLSIDNAFFKNYLDIVKPSGLIYMPRFDHSLGQSFRHAPENRYDPNNGMVCHSLSEEFIIKTMHQENFLNLAQIIENQDLSKCRAFGLILGDPKTILNLELHEFASKLSNNLDPWRLDPCYRKKASNDGTFYLDKHYIMPHQEERTLTVLNHMPAELKIPSSAFEGNHIRPDTGLLPELIRNYCVHLSPQDY
jgi:hypothetical protein